MSEQQLINYLLWMKERGQTVLVPNAAPSPVAQDIPESAQSPVAQDIPESAQSPVAQDIPESAPESLPESAPVMEVEQERRSYKVLFLSLNPLNSAEEEMVTRIGAALKLEPSEFAIAAGDAAQKLFASSDANAIVLMGEDAYPLVQARIHQTLLVISHPGAMLTEPQLKVTAWNALQKLKATL